MKRHIINDPGAVVPHALEGMALSYPDLIDYERRTRPHPTRHTGP